MDQVRFYVSFQGQIKDPWKWRIVRVVNGKHRTWWREDKQRRANEIAAFMNGASVSRAMETGHYDPEVAPYPTLSCSIRH